MQRASHEDMCFMRDVTTRFDCKEWNGFNTQRAREAGMTVEAKAKVMYLPLINKTPTSPTTIMTAIKTGLRLVNEARQTVLVFTVDQQLYKVSIDLLFYEPSLFRNVVPICGGMHWLMNAIHSIGVLLSPAIKSILASTFGSVVRMLQGKKYPQNFRAIRMIAEEMLHGILLKNSNIVSAEQLITYLENQSKISNTVKLWTDCLIKPVFIMLAFLRAAREKDLALHYASAKRMLPYFAAFRGHNYARYGTFYVHHLESLPTEMIKKLKNDCSLRVSSGIFNAIHTDQFIETTYMRLGHGPGGATGLTINERQMTVWALSFAT